MSTHHELIKEAEAEVREAHEKYARVLALRGGTLSEGDDRPPLDEHYNEAAKKLRLII